MEVEVDYVRVYQPIRSSPTKGTVWNCAAARNDVMLHLLEGKLSFGEGLRPLMLV